MVENKKYVELIWDDKYGKYEKDGDIKVAIRYSPIIVS